MAIAIYKTTVELTPTFETLPVLESIFPGKTRVELSLTVDGWETVPLARNWSGRGMVEPREKVEFSAPGTKTLKTRKTPNVTRGKLFLSADSLSEKELATVKRFIQDTTGLITLEFAIDNRPWTSPVAPVAEPRVPINTGILVALLGILGALGVVRFWGRMAKR